jgi:hypothetical protein
MNAKTKNYLSSIGQSVTKSASCSDWGRTWGFGTNKLGKLHLLEDGTYLWYGKAQGRHGQILIRPYFSHIGQNLELLGGDKLNIDHRDLLESIRILKSK